MAGIELSLEQQFAISSFNTQVQKMSREQAQEMLVKLHEFMVLRETIFHRMLRHQWGLEKRQDSLSTDRGALKESIQRLKHQWGVDDQEQANPSVMAEIKRLRKDLGLDGS